MHVETHSKPTKGECYFFIFRSRGPLRVKEWNCGHKNVYRKAVCYTEENKWEGQKKRTFLKGMAVTLR